MMIYLDTHVVVWLASGRSLSSVATDYIARANDIRVSPMVTVELQFLYEIKRITSSAQTVLANLADSIGLRQCNQSFIEVASMVCQQQWTRDPFDRFITAQAAIQDAYLVTRDQRIQRNYSKAVW